MKFELGDMVVMIDLECSFVGVVTDKNPIELVTLRSESGTSVSHYTSVIYSDALKMARLGFVYSGITMSPKTISYLFIPDYDYGIAVGDILKNYDRKVPMIPSPKRSITPPGSRPSVVIDESTGEIKL